MLFFALKYRKAIDTVIANKNLKLRKYELDNEEWWIVDDLVHVLEQYKVATIYFSHDTASVAAIIPAMDKLNVSLNHQTKQAYHPAIQAAMKLTGKKLNHYYSMTDDSAAYQIAMGASYLPVPFITKQVFSSPSWTEAQVLSTA